MTSEQEEHREVPGSGPERDNAKSLLVKMLEDEEEHIFITRELLLWSAALLQLSLRAASA